MVLNELIPMLNSQDLDTSRVGLLGWSMGGYGSLLLASDRLRRGGAVTAVAATSAAPDGPAPSAAS